MMERIRPKLRREVSAAEHGTKGIADSPMRAFARSVLMRGIGGGGFEGITGSFKECHDIRTTAKLTTEVETHIFTRDVDRETVKGKPMIQEVERRGLGAKGLTVEGTTIVVGDKAVAGLTIEALQAADTSTIGGTLNEEAKVDRDTLVTHGCVPGGCSAAIGATEFSTGADRAVVKLSSNRDLWNAMGIPMEVRDTARAQMPQTLMPEETELIASKVADKIAGIIRSE
jgi:hypothetical protein